jgi:hypothetical protein
VVDIVFWVPIQSIYFWCCQNSFWVSTVVNELVFSPSVVSFLNSEWCSTQPPSDNRWALDDLFFLFEWLHCRSNFHTLQSQPWRLSTFVPRVLSMQTTLRGSFFTFKVLKKVLNSGKYQYWLLLRRYKMTLLSQG